MKRALQVLNALSLFAIIAINYIFSNGQDDAKSMSTISARYENLLTPAGYAFSIWGLIYFGLVCFAIFQARSLFSSRVTDDGFVLKIGPWFIISNILNALWIVAFTYDHIGPSVLIIILLFLSLLKIILNLDMEKWDAPLHIILLIWWPFSYYFGWITVATITNISSSLVSLGWNGDPLQPATWAVIVLLIATAIFIGIIWTRNMREAATAGAWGLIAIGVRNWNMEPLVAYIAVAAAVLILINVMVHGYKNRALGPVRSWRPKASTQS
jgi:hypothetical protein